MTADTSNTDSQRDSDSDNMLEPKNKHLVAIVLAIIFVAIVLQRTGVLNFESNTQNNEDSADSKKINTEKHTSKTENDPDTIGNQTNNAESLYDRYTKKPMRYYQYDPIPLTNDYKIEVFKQFQTWVAGNLPPNVDDSNAKCKIDRLNQINHNIIVYNTPDLPEKPTISDNWKLTDEIDENCVLFVIIPPSKSPLPPEYWVKFIVHEDNVGKVYNFGLRKSVKRGFIWSFNGILFE